MSTTVLVTKLFIPAPGRAVVSRPRLIELLNNGLQGDLTLVCAPAGFGKSTGRLPAAGEVRSDDERMGVLDPGQLRGRQVQPGLDGKPVKITELSSRIRK